MTKKGYHMKRGQQLAILILLALAFPVYAQEPDYEEGIHFIRPVDGYIISDYTIPEFLSVEDVYVLACTEGDYPIKTSLLCLDNNNFVDLNNYKWTPDQNCYISDYNLKDFTCRDMMVQSEYTIDGENYRLTKNVRVNKLTKVLDHLLENQYSDGGWRDSLKTAYGIWGLSFYSEIFDYEIENGMKWLKLNRDDDEKCWPKSPCDMQQTANILGLLTISNYTDYYRVLNDGENFMKEMHLFYEQENTWKVSIFPNVPFTTVSLVGYEGEIIDTNFTLENDTWTDYSFKAVTGKELIVISDENIKAKILDQQGETLINYQGDNLSYDIPGACWSRNKRGEPCDLRTTLWNTMLDIPEEQIDQAKYYLENEMRNNTLVGYYLGDQDDPIDTSLFLYVMESSHKDEDWMDEIVDWVTYHQNNEGSWGDGNVTDKVVPTAIGGLALTKYGFNRSSEQIEDAEDWASENEEEVDVNDTVNQAALFSILRRNAHPLVTAVPRVLLVREALTTIDIFNPTTFNLDDVDYIFSDNLEEVLSLDKKSEISSYSYRKVKIRKSGNPSGTIYGYLTITNKDKQIGKIPVIVSDFPNLNITVTESLYVFGMNGDLQLTATKSAHEFICDVAWDSSEISTPGSFKISSETASFPVSFSRAVSKEEVYRGTVTCKSGDAQFTFPISPFFTRFSSEPLTVISGQSMVNSTDQHTSVLLKNNLDQDLTIDVSMDNFQEYFDFESRITLNPNEERNLTFMNTIPSGTNVTGQATITFTGLGRSKTTSIAVEVEYVPKKSYSLLKLIIILSFLSIVLGLLSYFGYTKREEIIKMLNKLNVVKMKQEVKNEESEIHEMKDEERELIIVNLFKIMRFQEKDDKDIARTLLKNFSREQVKRALEQSGNSLPGLDEEEPEKE